MFNLKYFNTKGFSNEPYSCGLKHVDTGRNM